jgi:hypothetical protein
MLHPLRAKQIFDHKMGLHFEDCHSIPMPITHVSRTGNTTNAQKKKNRINMRAKTVTADNLHLKHQKSL